MYEVRQKDMVFIYRISTTLIGKHTRPFLIDRSLTVYCRVSP